MAKVYLTSILDRDRVLLVLDDVWQQGVLNYLDVLAEAKGGVILVTTHDQGILRPIIDVVKIFEVPRLSIDDSRQLFSWHAFHVRGKMVPQGLETVAKEVANECQGLPLALEVIGSTMAGNQLLPCEVALGRTILHEWESALEHLRSANYGDSEYERLYYKLQLSVDSLREQDFRLQDCFFHFAAYPEDHLMEVEEVVHMWIAEGLVSNDEKIFFSSEEEGKVLVGILIPKSMIQLISRSEGWTPHCRVHDVMRDLIMRNLKWDFATRERIQVSARECLYAPGLQLSNFPDEWMIPNVPLSAKRLSFQSNDLQQLPHTREFNCPHLQMLILSENCRLESLFPSFIQKLSNLRVLSLTSTPVKIIPGALLKRLKALQLLDLSNCSDLQSVSDKVDSLQHLEIFLIPNTNLRKLPRMNNLTKLKYLSATVPSQQLTKRQRSAFGKSPLLPANLKRLEWIGAGDTSGDTRQELVLNLSSFRALEQLTLSYITAFPIGMMKLHHLKVLSVSRIGQTPWIPLGELPRLENLTVWFDSSMDTQLFGVEGGFPSLRYFKVSCEVGVDKPFVFHQGAMPKLERLEVSVKRREQLPASLVELQGLKHLFLTVGVQESPVSQVQRNNTLRNEDLEVLFNEKDCFPSLEYLGMALFSPISRMEISLPAYIVEREKEGKLRVELTH